MPPKQNQNIKNRNQPTNLHGNSNPPVDFSLKETSPSLGGGRASGIERVGTAFDLVEQMEYLFLRVVKAKELPTKDGNGSPDPFVEVKLGSLKAITKNFENISNPEWNQVFSILSDRIQSPGLEVLVRDKGRTADDLIGMTMFDIVEVPKRVPPDSPLAPQWYRLENKKGDKVRGDLMLAVWIGTQADEAFPEAFHLDAMAVSGDGIANIRSKVYLSPRLWYLRVNVIEALDLQLADRNRQQPEISVKVSLGNVSLKTKISLIKNLSPFWNEDLIFVVAEPFEEQLALSVEDKVGSNKDEVLGKCVIPLNNVEKRLDFKTPVSRWYGLEKHSVSENGQKNLVKLNSRVHLRISLDGGYHVLDELTHLSSDFKPTAKQLWRPGIGVLELGILSAHGLSAMKMTKDGHGVTDAYCVVKYGQKWIRTRTILNSMNPKWNEQYTWEVFDPCTVVTVGVFDNCHLQGADKGGGAGARDSKIGKVRIRLSTLETDRVYTHSYPLIVLSPSGVKKMGEVQLAVRFSCSSLLNMLQIYTRPLLPNLHHQHPLTQYQIERLRYQATQIVSMRLSRAEPPLRKEVVDYMLDVGSNSWSLRRSRAIVFRIASIFSGVVAFYKWFNGICTWRKPISTVFVHVALLIFVSFPRMILSTFFLYLLVIGICKYRVRPRHPPHMDIILSHADRALPDELDEEFDTNPSSRPADVIKLRYDRLRNVGSWMQITAADLANQGERFYSLLSWRDPRATALFLIFCFIACIVVYFTPFQAIVVVWGFYAMRHPRFRDKHPSMPINFFKRLPAQTDCLL
ncbi:hypothetical protein M9H77_03186 [Catharanthus roseus]|uniref:Uncharacterized protein n=1 Tax=Catharanthus roseus TaxID=4058 RepID=A0ACC0CB06_CATRO|nr:hypothetical protein M9H77_03186 [Catharanthus roseus]